MRHSKIYAHLIGWPIRLSFRLAGCSVLEWLIAKYSPYANVLLSVYRPFQPLQILPSHGNRQTQSLVADITRHKSATHCEGLTRSIAVNNFRIETERLFLIAANPELLKADLSGADQLCAALQAARPKDWPPEGGEYDEAAIRFFLEKLSAGGQRVHGWYNWYAVLRAGSEHAAVLVGNAGFFGPPDENGSVEVGYSVCKEWRHMGIATEIVRALIAHAWTNNAVKKALARAQPANSPSIGVLLRNGFQETSSSDPKKLQFELSRNPSSSVRHTKG